MCSMLCLRMYNIFFHVCTRHMCYVDMCSCQLNHVVRHTSCLLWWWHRQNVIQQFSLTHMYIQWALPMSAYIHQSHLHRYCFSNDVTIIIACDFIYTFFFCFDEKSINWVLHANPIWVWTGTDLALYTVFVLPTFSNRPPPFVSRVWV